MDTVGQRLLAIKVFAGAHDGHGDHRVGVIGGSHDHRVDVAMLLVEHNAEIAVSFRLGKLLIGLGGTDVVDIAQRDDILAGTGAQIGAAYAAHADRRDIEAFVWRNAPRHDPRRVDARRGGRKPRGQRHRPG